MTPDYLKFVEAEPKESPLGAALTGAMQTYGDVQKLREQTEIAKALPEQLKTQQQLAETKLTEEQARAGVLPTELQQETEQKQLLLNAMPTMLRNQINSEQLNNALNNAKLSVAQLSVGQLKDNYINNELGTLYGEKLQGLPNDTLNKQLQVVLKRAKQYGIDTSDIGNQWNDQLDARAAWNYANLPASLDAQKFHNKLVDDALVSYIKTGGKNNDPAYQEWNKGVEDENKKYFYEQLPTDAKNASNLRFHAQASLDILNAHPELATLGMSQLYSRLGTQGRKLQYEYNNILADAIKNFGSAFSKAPKSVQALAQSIKLSPNDSYKTAVYKLNQMMALTAAVQNEQNFANHMIDRYGVRDSRLIRESWNNFLQANLYGIHPDQVNANRIDNWANWFNQNKDMLPLPIAVKNDIQKLHYGVNQQVSTTQNLMQTGGLIPSYNPFSAQNKNTLSNLLYGGIE